MFRGEPFLMVPNFPKMVHSNVLGMDVRLVSNQLATPGEKKKTIIYPLV